MSLPMDHYWREDVARTLQEVKECAKKSQYSCQHCPLLDIPLENVVLDEFHLMLRVTGNRAIHDGDHHNDNYNFYLLLCSICNILIFLKFLATDILTKNLITAAIEWDSKDNLKKSSSQATKKHLHQVVTAIKECGVCFDVWEKTNADGRASGLYDWTSLMGSEKKRQQYRRSGR